MALQIDLPNIDVGQIIEYADWVELNCLFSDSGSVSQNEVVDFLEDAGIYGLFRDELYPKDEGQPNKPGMSSDAPGIAFVERIWEQLALRKKRLSKIYPFELNYDVLERIESNWELSLSFSQILLTAHTARYEKEYIVEREGGISFRTLFEKIVKASSQGLFEGRVSRFGVPREAKWPNPVNERIVFFSDELDLEILRTDLEETVGDRGLDVAARLNLGGDSRGTLIFLTQVATGKHWKTKKGEPSISDWQDVLRWEGKLIRSVAVPWWFASGAEYTRYFRRFDDAIILDRSRLLFGNPDFHLDEETIDMVKKWCESQYSALPKLN